MLERTTTRAGHDTLASAGFRDVSVLRGGMVRWNEAGLPVADRQAAVGGKEG
jgi:3-mercaptopyruvate sulfurtransferase SseA